MARRTSRYRFQGENLHGSQGSRIFHDKEGTYESPGTLGRDSLTVLLYDYVSSRKTKRKGGRFITAKTRRRPAKPDKTEASYARATTVRSARRAYPRGTKQKREIYGNSDTLGISRPRESTSYGESYGEIARNSSKSYARQRKK